jgi:hypothetical protein
VLPIKSRQELAALAEYERVRYVARSMWFSLGVGVAFGLQLAFLENFRTLGLLLAGITLLGIPCPTILTLRARRPRRQSS